MTPTKSYQIWFSPRTGSTLLCKSLTSTKLAGQPAELFNINETTTLCEQHQVSTYEQLKNKLWTLGTTSNGVFGIKYALFTSLEEQLINEVLQLKGIKKQAPINHEAIWANIFPNCKHIFLTRRNKIRQAVSWWKAIKDQTWHLRTGENQNVEADFYEKNYDFEALSHLYKEIVLRECATQAYFSNHHIVPLTLVYEDMVMDLQGTIQKIIAFLEVDDSNLTIDKAYYKKTANQYSEVWVQRFREDLQKNMGKRIW